MKINLLIICSTIILLSLIFIPIGMEEGKIVDYRIENSSTGNTYVIRTVIENGYDKYILFYNKDYEYVYEQYLKLKSNK